MELQYSTWGLTDEGGHLIKRRRAVTVSVSGDNHTTLYRRRPDMTFAVDWALSNNYLSTYLVSPL